MLQIHHNWDWISWEPCRSGSTPGGGGGGGYSDIGSDGGRAAEAAETKTWSLRVIIGLEKGTYY